LRFLFFIFAFIFNINADVIKPALVEISFYKDKSIELSLYCNLEAAMSEISNKYKDTKKSPNSDKYEALRALKSNELFNKFKKYESEFLKNFTLIIDGKKVNLSLKSHEIDFIGYVKRARKSILVYEAKLQKYPKSFSWKYYKAYGDSSLRHRLYIKDEYTWSDWLWIVGGKTSKNISLTHLKFETQFEKFIKFIKIGFNHVLPLGFDHVLFIIAMALSLLPWRQLLVLVTSFTLAHSVTLGLSMLEVASIPANIVEPLIALSIAYVAVENLMSTKSLKRKAIIIFLFGLLHGLGFAYMLKSFVSNNESFVSTLVGFNVGVELAQIFIVFFTLSIVYFLRKINTVLVTYLVNISLGAISLIGAYWFYDRLVIF
jgi:hypothetical protein